MRDEFSSEVKRALAARVGYRCSNPRCRAQTAGPQVDADGAVNVGVAAHITAAATGGPRYDASVPAEVRASAANGIWLCQICAKRIDSDLGRYSVDVLRDWKLMAEAHADASLGRPNEPTESDAQAPADYPDISVEQLHPERDKPFRAAEFFTVWAYSPAFRLSSGTVAPTHEDKLASLIRQLPPDDLDIAVQRRGATYVFFEGRAPDLRAHRKWGLWANGFLALSSTLRDPRSPGRAGEPGMYSVPDLALDLTYFFLVVGRLRKVRAEVHTRFQMQPYRLHPNLSPSQPQSILVQLGGVGEPVPVPQSPDGTSELDVYYSASVELMREVPDAISAKLVTYALRHFHGARVDEDELAASLEHLLGTVAAARGR